MTETALLDSNVLIASTNVSHIHHTRCMKWLLTHESKFATCPITQGAMVRFTLRALPNDSTTAMRLLMATISLPNHVFWPDDVSYHEIALNRIYGYRQATEAYLVALATHHGGRLVTLDESLVTVFPEAILIKD